MLPEHLRQVDGLSYEQITDILQNNGFQYTPGVSGSGGSYFRENHLTVEAEPGLVKPHLGKGRRTGRGGMFYYAYYEIESDFDFKSLAGTVKFDQRGYLVERTSVHFRSRINRP